VTFDKLPAVQLAEEIRDRFETSGKFAAHISLGRFSFRGETAMVRAFRDPDDATHYWVHTEIRIRKQWVDLPTYRLPEASIRGCSVAEVERIRSNVFEVIQQAWILRLHQL